MRIKINDTNGLILKTKDKVCKEDIEIIVDENLGSGINPTGTINITSNGIVDVTHYANANVQVPSTGITPSGTYYATSNGTYDVTTYASVNVNVPIPDGYIKPSGRLNISQNGVVDVTSYKEVNVSVSSGSSTQDMLQARVNATNSCTYLLYKFRGTDVNFLANLDTSQVTDMEYMYYDNPYITSVPNLDTSNVTSLYSTYYMCKQLKTLYRHNTNKVTNLNRTFYACSELKIIDISYFNISSTSNTNSMVKNCYTLKAFVIRGFGSKMTLNENAFDGCFYMLGEQNTTYNPNGEQGYVYVPRNMVATLQSATNWSVLQFRALEDYTLDGTTTGELDLVRMGIYNSGGSND